MLKTVSAILENLKIPQSTKKPQNESYPWLCYVKTYISG